MSSKRKIDAEGMQFNDRWEIKYMFLFQGEKTVCLLCYETVRVIKEYNTHNRVANKGPQAKSKNYIHLFEDNHSVDSCK